MRHLVGFGTIVLLALATTGSATHIAAPPIERISDGPAVQTPRSLMPTPIIGWGLGPQPAMVSTGVRHRHERRTEDDVVLEWNEIAVATIGAQPPFPSTRFMAMVELAVFEAVNAITGKYEPYLGTVAATAGASAEAAAIAAAHGVLRPLFPAAAATLDQLRGVSLARIQDGPAYTRPLILS